MNREFRKYLLYAFGEMALVIVGILIALQIDNWNTERKEKATLASYLQSIARNVREDLGEVETLHDRQWERVFTSIVFDELVAQRATYTVDDIFFANAAMISAQESVYFTPNSSSYDALKNSGVFDRLQGSDIEHLLSDYYDTVSRIEHLERDYNGFVNSLTLQVAIQRPTDIETYVMANPVALPAQNFEALQPTYRRYLNDPATRGLVSAPGDRLFLLLGEYERLAELGSAYLSAMVAGPAESGDRTRGFLIPAETPRGVGSPDIIVDGRVDLGRYRFGFTQPFNVERAFDLNSADLAGEALQIAYPGGSEWAAFYLAALEVSEGRPNLDFSSFARLEVSLKGDRGGERIAVHVKDSDDPDEESPASVEVTLTDDWQTYTFDLDAFAPTDFSILHVPLGFLFAEEPVGFSIRNARYVDDE